MLPCSPYQLYAAPSRSQTTLSFQPNSHACLHSGETATTNDQRPGSDSQSTCNRFETKNGTENGAKVALSKILDEVDRNFDALDGIEVAEKLQPEEEQQTDVKQQSVKCPANVHTLESGKSHEGKNPDISHKKKTAKAGDPNFVSEFYSHSRLHHISTWGSEFKKYVTDLRTTSNGEFLGVKKLQELKETHQVALCDDYGRVIMHIDMDCFFVSVGLLDRPDLLGYPVAVTHSKGQGPSHTETGSDPDYERKYWSNKKSGAEYAGIEEFNDESKKGNSNVDKQGAIFFQKF